MSDERKPGSPERPPIQQVQSPNFRVIYANGFAYKPSWADIGLTPIVQVPITQIVDGNVVSNIVGLQEVMIMLSLPAAKSLARNLIKFIEEIEKQIGDIRVTKQSIVTDETLKTISDELKSLELE